jgi:hypothetical protein
MRRTSGKVDFRSIIDRNPQFAAGGGAVLATRALGARGASGVNKRLGDIYKETMSPRSSSGAVLPAVMRQPPQSPFRETLSAPTFDAPAPQERRPPTYRTEPLQAPRTEPELY